MITLFIGQFIFFNLVYCISVIKKDFSIVDIAWGLSFPLIFYIGVINSDFALDSRGTLLLVLVNLWAIRLSGYILYRKKTLKGEDYRYAAWRKDWGEKANLIAYFKVFLLQAILSLIIASPLYLYHLYSPMNLLGTAFDYVGITFWIIGFYFQTLSDWQKHVYKSRPENQGKICKEGLWKYSRHPNYFGEALIWWGIFFIVINQVPYYFAFIGPLLIHFFLLKVSGVALLEQKYKGNIKYDEYKMKTNSFIPWFPRNLNKENS